MEVKLYLLFTDTTKNRLERVTLAESPLVGDRISTAIGVFEVRSRLWHLKPGYRKELLIDCQYLHA